jgi:hypothetical protein
MRRTIRGAGLIALALAAVYGAEGIKFPLDLDKLSERAKESVDVTLDASTLQLASGFLSRENPDEVQVKKLISKLKGIYVRSFEFDKEGEYSRSDVEALRQQLKSPAWSRIVGVKSIKGENTEVYLQKNGDQVAGLVVIDAEPKELTIVHIDGPIDPQELSRLGGHMGVPRIGLEHRGRDRAAPQKKEDSDREDNEQ